MKNRDPDQQILDEYERRIAEGTDLEGLQRVEMKSPKNPRAVFSIRLSREEFESINEAARLRGMRAGDFIRDSAIEAAQAERQIDDEQYTLATFRADVARLNRRVEKALQTKAAGR